MGKWGRLFESILLEVSRAVEEAERASKRDKQSSAKPKGRKTSTRGSSDQPRQSRSRERPRQSLRPQAQLVEESVTVVLRRQIPVRFDEPPRSWIGGLPMMPDHVEWPTGRMRKYPEFGEQAMHFVAQISCADFPREIWGGLGPRDGWLLLFLNAWDGCIEPSSKHVRVIHIEELGPERNPPAGLLPVRNLDRHPRDYLFARSQRDVPTIWRRWPVDLVVLPHQPFEDENGYVRATPDDFAPTLYEGAPVASELLNHVETELRPFSWRGALHVVDGISRQLAQSKIGETPPALMAKMDAPGWLRDTVETVKAEIARWHEAKARWDRGQVAPGEAERVRRERALTEIPLRLARLESTLDFLSTEPDVGSALAGSSDRAKAWLDRAADVIEPLRDQILARQLDTPLAPDDWDELWRKLEEYRMDHWRLTYEDVRDGAPSRQALSLAGFAAAGLKSARLEIATDYYATSPEKRALIPAGLVRQLEPYWRRLDHNRPHRVGGVHDAIQSEAQKGPTDKLLLLQLASDDAMHWLWGDSGAVYVFIGTDALQRRDFDAIEPQLECH